MKKNLSFLIFLILFGILNAHAADVPKVVISGVYGGGGNNNSIYKNDYIELYNTTNTTINLSGYALYYFAYGGTNAGVSNTFTFPDGSTIGGNSFALIKAAAGNGTQPAWEITFDFDASGSAGTNLSMSATTGKVLLLSAYTNFTTSGSSLPTTLAGIQALAGYMDYMPYGKNATPVFGSSTNDLAANKAASRKYDGNVITYTFNVGADFDIITADENAPRNSNYGNSNRVATPTFSPAGGNFSASFSATISCTTPGATIRYSLDGNDPTTSSPQYTNPITVSAQTTIKAMAWKEGMETSKVGMAVYNFPQKVSTLAALRALAPPYDPNLSVVGTTVFQYTGHAIVTQKQKFHNIKYIQDGTGAMMVFDAVGGNIQEDVEIGDKITNITGTLTNYFGMIEIIPQGQCDVLSIMQQAPAAVISVAQLDNDHLNPIQGKLVRLMGAKYVKTGVFEAGKYYDLTVNTIPFEAVVYTDNWDADYILDGTQNQIPTIATTIDGVCLFKGSETIPAKNRIVPIDHSNGVIGVHDLNKSSIKLSPNPADNFVNIITGVSMKLEVYSLLGNLIATESLSEGSNTISVSQYPAGMYLIKLIDSSSGQSYVQKLVVR